MKKQVGAWLAGLLLLLAMLPQVSAAEAAYAREADPIEVWLGYDRLYFDVDPIIKDNTVFVEFRSIFEVLGFKITYDSKTKQITGNTLGTKLQMKVNAKETKINGKLVPNTPVPFSVGGRTMVPLRLVGEAAGMDVKWVASDRVVMISYRKPSAEIVKDIKGLLAEQAKAYNARDWAAYKANLAPGAGYLIRDEFEQRIKAEVPTKIAYNNIEIDSWRPREAGLSVDIVSKKVDPDSFYIDQIEPAYIIVEQADNGAWRMKDISLGEPEYLNAEEVVSQKAALPEQDKEDIVALFQRYEDALNQENLNRLMAVFDEEMDYAEEWKEYYEEFFDYYDIEFTNKQVDVIYYKENTAYVYVLENAEVIQGDVGFTEQSAEKVFKAVKNSEGKWKIDSNYLIVGYEIY